jgi:ADP-ribosylglycohydrolase
MRLNFMCVYGKSRLNMKHREAHTIRLLTGLAAGDSLGSTSEFTSQQNIPALYNRVKDRGWPFQQVGGGRSSWNSGDPTDDTDMALCIIRPFLRNKSFEPKQIAQEFVSWMKSGPKDIGMATSETLRICEKSSNYWDGGLSFWKQRPEHAANGSLMRNGVVAGMADSLDQAFEFTLKHGMITHYAPLPQICCLAQTYLIYELLNEKGFSETWQERFQECLDDYLGGIVDPEIERWQSEVSSGGHFDQALSTFNRSEWDMNEFSPFNTYIRGNGGYCLLTLQIAVWDLYWSLRKEAPEVPRGFPTEVFNVEGPSRLAWVVMVGHDADTYGAAAGPLIVAAHSSLPSGMTTGLKALQTLTEDHR